MYFPDLISILHWWFVLLIVGLTFFPVLSIFFERFIDNGYIFSKLIGTAVISYVLFLLGIFHLISFAKIDSFIFLIIILSACISEYIFLPRISHSIQIKKILMYVFEEVLFLMGLFLWSYVRGFQPDLNGLEKFMDFGFVNSILRSNSFPPKDIWFTPFPINYYYFGHLTTAVLTKLSGIPSFISYNLMIATLFSLTFSQSFSIGINLIYMFLTNEKKLAKIRSEHVWKMSILGGFVSAFFVSFGGNLHTIYSFFSSYNTTDVKPFTQLLFAFKSFPNSYWYPNATRFIFNTIHEFPLYSFVVSDLHGHVLDIPVVLTIIVVLFHVLQSEKIHVKNILFLSFFLAVSYMTNAWDGGIYFLLVVCIFSYILIRKNQLTIYNFIFTNGLLAFGFLIFSLPFSIFFTAPISGIGVLCAPDMLTKIGKIGPLLFEQNHCQRSPLWQLGILYGFFYFWVISFFIILFKRKKISTTDWFVLILIFISTTLIFIPEFVYLKDIYPAHFRANTMFKLVYQSFIMLSLSSGYIFIRIFMDLKKNLFGYVYLLVCTTFLFLVAIFPYFAITSYYNSLNIYHGLNGITYLKNTYPADYDAIVFLNEHVSGQPVILEAQGDSFTDYARVSANTGLPTVLGWLVHEWLWRKTYDVPAPRIEDVKTLYESSDIQKTKQLIKKYNVEYVFIGTLERQKYSNLAEEKFKTFGFVVFQKDQTIIYKLRI